MLLSIAGPTDLTLHEVNQAADAITRVAHPDANIIFGAVVDDALGEEVRVTVVAAGFDKVTPAASGSRRTSSRAGCRACSRSPSADGARTSARPLPSILVDDDDERRVHDRRARAAEAVSFDAEEDLDIPDFLKS